MKYIDPFSKEAKEMALKFDDAYIKRDSKIIVDLIKVAEESIKEADNATKAQICYSIATAYGDLANIDENYRSEEMIEKQIYYYRRSIELIDSQELRVDKYEPYVKGFKRVLYTNTANCLDSCGRKIAAIQMYAKGLKIDNGFGMTIGNLGMVYRHYGMLVYDPSHRDYFHYFAYHNLKYAIGSKDVDEEARSYFINAINSYDLEYIENILEPKLDIPQYYYETKEEEYREWCLNNHLFLNPLNDLDVYEYCFAADVLQLPDITMQIEDKPVCHGMFNQLKQEYIYARFLMYDSLEEEKVHFADKDTYLLNFSDYPKYSIRIEKLKTAYKTLYSILDKTAYFINRYFELGIKERDVSFRSIWLSEKQGKNAYKYKNILKVDENYGLRAIYWIRKDFYECIDKSTEPQAKFLCDLRNALEHKYVKVCENWSMNRDSGEIDDLAFYVSEDELKYSVLKLLKIIRELIINISIAVNIEEDKRHGQLEDRHAVKMYISLYEDEWKR